jgi:hypothetical protein
MAKIDCEGCCAKDMNFCGGNRCMYKEDMKYGKRDVNYTPYLKLPERGRE